VFLATATVLPYYAHTEQSTFDYFRLYLKQIISRLDRHLWSPMIKATEIIGQYPPRDLLRFIGDVF
jgi:hypothetical protein